MPDKYICINIKTYLDESASSYTGEDRLNEILSGFTCPKIRMWKYSCTGTL